ncbi:hypothetical protein L7F22_023004 [Adiantum nelumboides]|nr:hypothetical protein [Adiantum nelumboides]
MKPAMQYSHLDIEIYHNEEREFKAAIENRKWKGGLKATMDIAAGRVWEMMQDFGGIQKWALIAESKLVQGLPNVEGCVRFCKSMLRNALGEDLWVEERLLVFDSKERFMSYAVVDCNMDMHGYIATIRVLEGGPHSSIVEWLFELDPTHGKEETQTVESITRSLAAKINHLYALLAM